MAVTIGDDFLNPPDDGTPPDLGGIDAGAGDNRDFGTDFGGAPVDTSSGVGAAAVDVGSSDNNKNGVVGISGYTDPGAALSAEQRFFQDQNPQGGSFVNQNPIDAARFTNGDTMGQATAQGPSLGNGRPLTVEEQAFQSAYPNGGSFDNQGRPTGGGALPGNRGGGGAPAGTHELLGAGPGYEIGGGYGNSMMFNDNMPTSTKLNMGWEPGGYVGPNTMVPGGAGANDYGAFGMGASEGQRFGQYGNGIGANGRPIDVSGLGTRGISGGLFGPYEAAGGGGLAPIGPGVNMGWNSGKQQMEFNSQIGQAPLGGGGVNGPGLAFIDPVTGQPVTGGGLPGNRTTGIPGQDVLAGTYPTGGGGLPGNRGTGMTLAQAAAQLPAQYANDPFAQRFEQHFGFFDPKYNSEPNMVNNLKLGDIQIRGADVPGGTGEDQAAYMAQFDPNLRAELAAINGTPNFYNSEQAVQHTGLHNQQIENRIPTEFANNTAAAANLRSQMVKNVPSNPETNFNAMLAEPVHGQAIKALQDLGATNIKIAFDPTTGGMELTWDAKNGNPNAIPFDIANSSALLAELDRRVAAQGGPVGGNAPRGGGYGGGRSYGPRGGGGGGNEQTAPPAATGGFENDFFNGRGNFGEGGIPGIEPQPTYAGNVYNPAAGYPGYPGKDSGQRQSSGLPY